MRNNCRNCCYLEYKETKDYPLDDYNTKYNCLFHGPINSRVSHPDDQKCDYWFSKLGKKRDDQLGKLGIN